MVKVQNPGIEIPGYGRQDGAGQSKGQKGGAVMEAAWFIFGAFVGSIVATFTLCMFMVYARRGR